MFWCAPGRSNTSSTWSKTFESFQKNKKNTNFTCEHLEDKIPKDGLRKVLLSRNDMTVHHRINTTSTELRSYSGGWGNYAASKVTPSLPNSLETHVQTIRVRHCRFDQDVCLLSDSDKGHLEHESSTSSPKNSFALPSAFTALKDVVITHCCLREIPAELFSLPCLVSLNLSFNRFQSGIPSSFWKCKTLKRLELQCIEKKANMSAQVAAPFAGPADTAQGYSSAMHIPKPPSAAFGRKGSTGSLPDFTHKSSKLGEFPPSPSHSDISSAARPPPVPAHNSSTANQTISVNGNKDEMELSYIDLTGSGVTLLSPFIGYLTNLRTLKLSQNHIRRLPTVLTQLTQLCILEIDHNPILNIPADLKAKPGLELVCGLPDMILPGLYLGDINCALNASALSRCGIQRIISVLETDGAVVHPGIDTLVIDVSDNPGSELGFQSICLPYFARFAMLPRPQRPTPAALGLILPIAEDDMNYCVLDPVLLGFDGSTSMEHFFHPPVRNDLDIQLFRSDPNDKHDEVDNETCCSSSCQSGTFTQSAVDDGTDNSDAGSACRSLSRQSSIKSGLDGLSKLYNSAHQRTFTDNNNTNELLDEGQNNLVLHEQIELYSQLWRAGGAVLHRLPTPIYGTPTQTESIHASMHQNEPQFCVLASDEPQLGIDYTQAPRIEIHIVNDPILLQKDNTLSLAGDNDEQSENASLFPVPILIHCRAGVSRSATLVISLVMLIKQWPLARAFLHVKKCRSTISPNFGFYRQLIHFEATLIRAGILRGDEPEFMRPSQHPLSDSDLDDVKFVWPSLNVREYLALCSSEMTAAVWEARYGTREAFRYFTKPAGSKQGTGMCTEAQHVSSIGISSKYHSSNVADVSSKRISSNVSDLYKTGIKPHEVSVKYDTPSDANITTTLSDKTSLNSSSASANTQTQPSGQENIAPDSVANPSPNSANSGSGFALPPFTPSPIKSRSNSSIPDSPNVSSGTPDTVCRQSSVASQGTNGVSVPADVRKQNVAVSNAADTTSSASFIKHHANSDVRSKHSHVTDAPIGTTHAGSSAGSNSTTVTTTQSAWVSSAVETVSSFDQESIETDTLKHIHSNKSSTTGSAEASLSAAYLFGGKNIGASSTHTPGAITLSTIGGGADEILACSTAHGSNTLQTVSAAHIGTMRLTPQACDISLPTGETGAGVASPFSDTSLYGIADGNGLRTPNMSMHSTSTHHAPQPSLSFDPAPSLNQQLSMELNKLGISTIISPRLRCLEPADATSVNNQQSKGSLGNLDVNNNCDKVTTMSDHNSGVKETSSQGIDPNLASVQASHISYFFSVRTSPEHGYVRSHVPYNLEAKPDVATNGLSKNGSDQVSRSVPAPCDYDTSSTTNSNNSPQPITATKKHDKIRQIHDVSISVASAPYVRSTVNPRFPWLARRIPAREVAVQMRKASENGFWFDSTEAKNFVVASTPQLGVGTGYFGLRNPYLPMRFSGDSMFEIAYNQKKHLLNKKLYGFDASPPKIASTLERVSHASATLQSNVRKVSSMISLSTANGQKTNIDELNKTYKNSGYNETTSPQKRSHLSKKAQIFPSVKSLAHSASSVKLSVVVENANRLEPTSSENHTQYDVHQSHSTDQNVPMQHQNLNSTKKQHSTTNIDHATPSTRKKEESIVRRHRRHSFGV